jgi:hypothetical protein
MLDPMTSLAFSLYSGKGVHALLLGSGISRSSGIPMGWEIVLDLIRKVAAIEGQECGDDLAAWYVQTYEKEPSYTELLEMTAKGHRVHGLDPRRSPAGAIEMHHHQGPRRLPGYPPEEHSGRGRDVRRCDEPAS